jgi:hypothetical protein
MTCAGGIVQTFIRYAALVCVIALPFSRAAAQSITITEEDVRQQMEVGKFTTTVSDTLTKSVNIGSTGATSWDFSALLTHTSTQLLSVTPSSTPYISSFPDATFALETVMSVAGISGTAYIYLVLDTNLMNPGIMAGTSTFLGPIVYHRTHTPSDITYALPSTFGTTWTSVYTSSEIITLNGNPISTTSNNHNASYLVDAYGPMTLPGGYVEDALRIRKYDSTSTWKAVSYIFLAKSGASVQLSPSESFPPDTGTIAVTSVTWNGPLPTDVEAASGTPTEYVLRQNFPNPFNPSTTIRFAIPQRAHVTLAVFNTLGQQVATLVQGEREAGSHEVQFDASGLVSGVYLYRLHVRPLASAIGQDSKSGAGAFLQTRTMLLLK